jgi:hypothetical protein
LTVFLGTLVAAKKTFVAAPRLRPTTDPASHLGVRYAHVLRCIGQSLEALDLRSLELRTHGGNYVVQGWNRGIPVSKEVDKQYTLDDIKKLEVEGRAQRKPAPGPPNLLSLSQVLRLAGNYVDRMHGRLIRISWQDQSERIQSVTIQFESSSNERAEQGDSQITTIEELCVHVYKQRKRLLSTSDKASARPLVNVGNLTLEKIDDRG